ncbi:hypothetical protein LCGC14_2230320 [marine sediment metagenome]|uniref:Uncharacterized protein n=1 Tax=marine sediment metagenome TaxID=412755 RepID=A0A0F9DW46_9ZZZZ
MPQLVSHFALFFDKENNELQIVAVRDEPDLGDYFESGDFTTVVPMQQFLRTSTDEPIILSPDGKVQVPSI